MLLVMRASMAVSPDNILNARVIQEAISSLSCPNIKCEARTDCVIIGRSPQFPSNADLIAVYGAHHHERMADAKRHRRFPMQRLDRSVG